MRRRPDSRLAGGVAAGLAARTGFDVTAVRVVFVLATLASGLGAAAYVVAWLVIPAAGAEHAVGHRARSDRRGIALVAGLVSLLVVVLFVASVFRVGWIGTPAWSLGVCLAGLVLIWRNAPADEQAVLRRLVEPLRGLTEDTGMSRTGLRLAVAAVLVAGGLTTLLSGHASTEVLRPLGGVALVLAAAVVVLGPWWLHIARDMVVERQARVRAEERAELASRVHDSVLQTLALIQRRADDPQQVVALARAQERELRAWLFGGRPPGLPDAAATTLAAGIAQLQQEVEARHGVALDTVVVGDCALDDDVRAVLGAAREAAVNAVTWSGADVVTLFAEVEPDRVSVFVRDRGRGFDPAAVPADRRGLAESVRGRMARRGGSATVRSAPGEGTEVALSVPRAARERHGARL